jgi:hypothetical protein
MRHNQNAALPDDDQRSQSHVQDVGVAPFGQDRGQVMVPLSSKGWNVFLVY